MVITNCTAALNTQQEFLFSLLMTFGNKRAPKCAARNASLCSPGTASIFEMTAAPPKAATLMRVAGQVLFYGSRGLAFGELTPVRLEGEKLVLEIDAQAVKRSIAIGDHGGTA